MSLWRKREDDEVWPHREPFYDDPDPRESYTAGPSLESAMALHEGPRYNPHPGRNEFIARIPFDPGAPQYTYAVQGMMEIPLVTGFPQRFQFNVYQPQTYAVDEAKMSSGLGQSWSAQPPRPAAEDMYTQDQLDVLTDAAVAGWGEEF